MWDLQCGAEQNSYSLNSAQLQLLCSGLLILVASTVQAVTPLPPAKKVGIGQSEPFCNSGSPPEWREAGNLDGVNYQESRLCNPDNPADIAAFVKGTNNISMETLMATNLAPDAVTMSDDMDGDGDPDRIVIKLEIMEINGHSPDTPENVTTFDIAPGIQPAFWVFVPKMRDMSTKGFGSPEANALLRLPSPTIRIEQGDTVWLELENTHYFPHAIHLHGVDHPFKDRSGEGNDGVGQTSGMDIMPGQSKTYVINSRQPGTMYYHCHVQSHTHIAMGMAGLFVIEENRPNNWVQTFNIGDGQVRHPSVAVLEKYAREYDLHFQSFDKELHEIPQSANDPRLIAQAMNQEYDITEASDDYFVLNGRAFPYTLRESLIVVDKDERIKLRVLNGHSESMALHIHGHKATETHYDGVEQNPVAQVTRDVYALAPAQRVDLELNTHDDGLHSYGSGLWLFHDHVETAFTTNGIGDGGNISMVAYREYLDPQGMPKTLGMDLTPFFTKEYWARQYPVWQDWDQGSFNQPESMPSNQLKAAQPQTAGGFSLGLILGSLVYLGIMQRNRVIAMLTSLKSHF
ncbi:multicopper oxidase domain-containing protein [Methylomonas paludis]|uniref:Multicopper oxidase domain-containing protein n=1 Tax=Methylomonas paludis TaxID=1173101 RepID=A0A975ML31_9GAMM|nr:multicopper oxidase domain-containing protein [Methylomonas paludis]QWF69777.1 multicopper oxidase domain-containing protein [Methylomonas paludis]